MSYLSNAGAAVKGTIAIGLSDLIVFKAVPMIPFPIVQNNPMAVRLALALASVFAMDKSKMLRDAMLCSAAHNTASAAYTIQQVHDFVGIHGTTIDQAASEAVANIEAQISDKIAEFKESLNDGPLSSPLSSSYEEIQEYDLSY